MMVSLNGRVVGKAHASVQAETDGLFYGAGCFETFTSYSGKFLHLDRHIRRLNEGVSYLAGAGDDLFYEEQIRSEILELLEANKLSGERVRVRVQVSMAERLGYSLAGTEIPDFSVLITAAAIPERLPQTYSLATVETKVVPASCRPVHLKLSNMLHYRQAGIEAKQAGADDALMLTVNGFVAETSIANIFWEKDGVLYTPSASCDILPGVTRGIVLDLIKTDNGKIIEGEFTLQQIKSASRIWICNSIKEISTISDIDGLTYPTDSTLSRKLRQDFETYKKENLN